jgi:tRNA nucleotidyltransferase/poly(A) polymerase
MKIRDVLLNVKILANENNLSEPFIVGGLPRDKVLKRSRMVDDVDITTGDDTIQQLAILTSQKYKAYPVNFPDGHYQVAIGQVRFDFSSNYRSPDVEYFLERAGVKNPTPMQLELFSRDFTCNTLTIAMNLRVIEDQTGLGLNDINKKILRTPLPPRITLRDDPRRVIRAIYLAAKLGFTIEEDIIEWAKSNPDRIKEKVKPGFSRNKLLSAFRYNSKNTLNYITSMNLWDVVIIPKDLLPYRVSR